MATQVKQQLTYPTGRTLEFTAEPISHAVAIQPKAGGAWEVWGGYGDHDEAYKEAAYLAGYSRLAAVRVVPVEQV